MFIGEIVEVGVIEPLVVPEWRPTQPGDEPVTADPSRVEEPAPTG